MDSDTGRLHMLSKAATGSFPFSVAVTPSGKYAYVANEGDNTVSQYTVANDGYLSVMSPATVSAGSQPEFIVNDPSGKHDYL